MKWGRWFIVLLCLSLSLETAARVTRKPKNFQRQEIVVSADIRVVDPGNAEKCITITVTAEGETNAEKAADLKDKILAAYAEFGRCPD